MPTQSEQVAALRSEISRGREFLDSFEARPNRVLLDHTAARFLWWSIADAELVFLAADHEQTAGLSPVLRHMFETTLDVMHLIGVAEDAEVFAVGTLVGEILDWDASCQRAAKLVEEAPTLADVWGAGPDQTAEEAFELIARELEGLGQDTVALRSVYAENRDLSSSRRRVHCTGLDRVSLILQARRRFSDGGEETARIAGLMERLWREGSARGRAHSSPGWRTLRVEQESPTGRLRCPDPAGTLPRLERAASVAANMLMIVNNFIEWYTEHRDDEE